MQLPNLLTLSLLASTSFALPTTTTTANIDNAAVNFNETLPSLDKRGHYGWVAAFADNDLECKAGYALPRPKIKSDCVKFEPVSTRVKIDWGTGPLGFHMLNVYADSHCKQKMRTIHKYKSGDSCVGTGGLWGSVKSTDVVVGHE